MSTYFEKIEDKVMQWKLDKWGKFSGSQIHRLIPSKPGKDMFDKTALNYIDEVVCQACTAFEDKPEINKYDVRMGKINEPYAFKFYSQVIGFDKLEYYGGSNPIFVPYNEHSGVSPDCVAKLPDGRSSFGAEFKCLSRDNHKYYLEHIKEPIDLKIESMERYAQIQFNMMVHNVDLWHFAIYNEYFPLKSRMHIIEITPDKPFQTDLKIRIAAATKLKIEMVEKFKKLYS